MAQKQIPNYITSKNITKQIQKTQKELINIDSIFINLVNYIKQREGFKSQPYICPAGYLTIGYGHRTKNITDSITEYKATLLLKRDIFKNLSILKHNKVNDTIILSLTSLGLNIGIYKVLESKLIKYKSIEKVKNKISKYIYYKNKDNVYVKSNNLIKSREFENNLIDSMKLIINK